MRRALNLDILNIRAVARLVQSNIPNRKVSLESIITAIRRYPKVERSAAEANIAKMLNKLTMRNGIVDVDINNSPEIPAALGRIASQVDYSKGEAFRILVGVESDQGPNRREEPV